MVSFAGWEMPLNYPNGIVAEHLTTRRLGGLFDISHMGRFSITGEGALPFLQYVFTNNAAALEVGQAQYTIIADENGGAVDDAYLYRLGEKEFLLVVNASNTEKDWDWLQKHLKNFSHLTIENKTEEIAMAALQGPKSKTVLENLLRESGSRLPDPVHNYLRQVSIEGTPVTLSRTGYTGEPLAFELFFPASKAIAVWEKIFAAGQQEGVIPVGLGARDTLRLEACLPLYGHEYGMDPEGRKIPILAVPAAKIAVSFSPLKGEYIGREMLWQQFQELKLIDESRNGTPGPSRFVPRRFFPLAILSEGVVRPNFPVYGGDKPIGRISSGTMVPYWKFEGQGIFSRITENFGRRAIAFAYLDAESKLQEGQKVRVQARDKFIEAVVMKRHLSTGVPPYARPILYEKFSPIKYPPSEPLPISARALVEKAKKNTHWRQRQTINLIPSEQTPSPLVKLLSVADPSDRYAEHRNFSFLGEADVYYYQGTAFIEEVELKLAEQMLKYLGSSQVETRIISGQMANAVVFSALMDYLNRFDRKTTPRRIRKVMNHHLGRGGHLSSQPMGALRDFVATDPQTDRAAALNFPVLEDNPYQIDLQRTEEYLHQHRPELIILGKSMMIYREPLRELRRMADCLPEKPFILYDMAHVLGLIGPHFQQPFLEGADIVTGSTHKTFFGTQRGIISHNYDESSALCDLGRAITRRTFPGSVSNHHLGTLSGLLLAAYEMNAFADQYQKQIVANAKAFAKSLRSFGLQVEGDPRIGYTETHQVLLRVGYARGPEAAQNLERNNLIVNYQALPDDEGFSVSSGLRMGVQEMTRFGMKEKDFEALAGYLAEVIIKNHFVGDEIVRFRSRFTEMQYCLPLDQARPLIEEIQGLIVG